MAEQNQEKIARPLVGKILVRGLIRLQTGLRIGGGKGGIGIGDLDNPVIREGLSQEPYIPGSSLKGKLRSLLERTVYREQRASQNGAFFSRSIGSDVRVHVCKNADEARKCPVCRLFGSSGDEHNQGSNFPSRLKIRDAFLAGYSRNKLVETDTGSLYTEIKSENAVDRITAAANPRSVERVPAGSDFRFEMVYDVEEMEEKEGRTWQNDMREDLDNLYQSLRLLEDDALGGYGSRGYGQVLISPYLMIGKKAEYYLSGDAAFLREKTISRKLVDLFSFETENAGKENGYGRQGEPAPADCPPLSDLKDPFKEILAFFGS